MAKFTDLVFGAHPVFPDGTLANFTFPNGYGISVITGTSAYTSPAKPYEAAVTLHGALCYDTLITHDVRGHETADGISEIMAQIVALPAP